MNAAGVVKGGNIYRAIRRTILPGVTIQRARLARISKLHHADQRDRQDKDAIPFQKGDQFRLVRKHSGDNSGEPARWAAHESCLRLSAGRDVYVKMVVDEETNPAELEAGARLVASVDEAMPIFLQPITDPGDGALRIQAKTLEALYRRVAAYGLDVRIVPQTHKILGVP